MLFTLSDVATFIAQRDELDDAQTKTLLRNLRAWESKGVLVADTAVGALGTRVFLARNVPLVLVIVALIARVGLDPSSDQIRTLKVLSPDLQPAVRVVAEGGRATLVIGLRKGEGWRTDLILPGDPMPDSAMAAIFLNLNELFRGLPLIEG